MKIKTDMWCGNADHSPDQGDLIRPKPEGLPIGLPVWYGSEIFFSTMVLQIYYVTSVVQTLWFILRSRFSLDPLYSQANWYNGTEQLG